MEKYNFDKVLANLENMPNEKQRIDFLEKSKENFALLSDNEKQQQRKLATQRKNELLKQTKELLNFVNA